MSFAFFLSPQWSKQLKTLCIYFCDWSDFKLSPGLTLGFILTYSIHFLVSLDIKIFSSKGQFYNYIFSRQNILILVHVSCCIKVMFLYVYNLLEPPWRGGGGRLGPLVCNFMHGLKKRKFCVLIDVGLARMNTLIIFYQNFI